LRLVVRPCRIYFYMIGDGRDTANGGQGGARLHLLGGGLDRAAGRAPGLVDGGWRVGPGVGAAGAGQLAEGDPWGAAPPAECVVARSAVRAGDRHEPWTLPVGDALRALAGAAGEAGVDVELAVRLTVECALVCDDLRAAGVDPAALDAVAAAERVAGELDAAAAAYLRRLTGRRRGTAARALGEVVTAGLPLRLSARLLAADLDALVAAVPLERALAWETAAVLAGRTMSEWAPLAALRLAR